MLIQVLYISRSTYPRGDLTDLEILKTANRKNKLANVTGALLRDNRRFLQILEGETAAVLHTIEAIQQDPRHFDVNILFQRAIETRFFGDWSMGYSEINKETVAQFESLSKTFSEALDAALVDLKPSIQTPAL
ncbi:BLUF domain-containing protein [uncultured Pelagimonas sp.]|uniref:BLUF domain-containing protein n=1 Tax=uncultured Pelagimonas sp. TaxID=1618102 RepID=UPI0026074F33|nr:BLUF domain-containing protein [uncultured Pelagimonas sp.]